MIATIRLRRGTAAEWTAKNPVLTPGEPGYETDTNKFKLGNGSSAWTVLPYVVADSTPIAAPAGEILFGNEAGDGGTSDQAFTFDGSALVIDGDLTVTGERNPPTLGPQLLANPTFGGNADGCIP